MSDTSGPDHRQQSWIVIASFFAPENNTWLDDFISDKGLSFRKIAPPTDAGDWHRGRTKVTSLRKWINHLRQSRQAVGASPDGIIACFPQLAIATAFWKRLGRAKPRIIAYNFNLGELRGGMAQRLARSVASQIDCYVVHSPEEIDRYADYLAIPPDRIRFVPLQRGVIEIPRNENFSAPFVVSMGSAHRDYPTLIQAVDRLGVPTIIVTRSSDIPTLPKSPHVSFRSNLTEQECLELMAEATLCVTPIANVTTASGQVTFINAMQLGVPVIATRCPGTDGYIEHEIDGILVRPFDVDDLATAIDLLWQDPDLRGTLSANARTTAQNRFSDEMAADQLHRMILSLT